VIEPALKFLVFFGSFHRAYTGFRIEFAVGGPFRCSCSRLPSHAS
jgi:hypothetical protein